MKKTRLLSIALFACLMVAAFVFCLSEEVKAETFDNYTYTVTDGKATITKCRVSASGHIAVPANLGGYPVTAIGSKAFDGCSKLVRITLSEGITAIEDSAFINCTQLEEITLPEGFTTIGANAFGNCTKLTKLNVPSTIEHIDYSAVSNWNSLTYNEYGNGKYLGNSKDRYIVLMDTVTNNITSCEIHKSTKVIFDRAFFECVGLTNIIIPEGVRTIGENAFFRCTNLRKVTIGKGVTTIGEKAFYMCWGLTAVTIPDGVTTIGKEAFSNCNKIADIVFPKSLMSIGEGAFNGCKSLQNVYYKGAEAEWVLIAGKDALQNTTISYNASGCIHKWDEGVVTKEANCVETGIKIYTCTVCQEKCTEELPVLTTHTYKNDCDTDCDICGQVREITHSYDTAWHADETGHWHECAVCGDKKDIAVHAPGAEPTETAAQICTICGYIIQSALGHTHNFSTEWKTDGTGHWHGCDGCEEKGKFAAHSFENDCDTDCAVCGYVRTIEHSYKTEWSVDGEKHWHECTVCGNKKDENAHIPGAEPTETAPQTCTACGYVLAPAIGTPDPTEPPTEPAPDGDEGSDLIVTIIVVATIVAAATLGIVEVVFLRKKRK